MTADLSMPSNGRYALVNGRVVLPDEVVAGKAVVVNGSRIEDVTGIGYLGSDVPQIDVGGRIITPGLIDIHTHGALGHTFNEPTAEAFRVITEENGKRGVTSLVATTATAPIADLVASLEFTRRWMGETHTGAQVLGAHVEGPYFSLPQAGAQDPANIRNPNDGTVDQLLEHHDVIRQLTYAPELPGAIGLTRKLVKLGIVAAGGHSSAIEVEVAAAIDAGMRHIIHIWSAQSTTVREGPWRKPGMLEVTLTYPGLTVEMICDNKHLPPTLMKLAYKCIGPDRLCAISDATSGAGLPEGSKFSMGEMSYDVHDGVGMMLDRSAFAGSTTLLNQMVPILMEQVGVSLPRAVRMASLNPARVLGIEHQKGRLKAGRDADIAVFNEDFTAWGTAIGGRWQQY